MNRRWAAAVCLPGLDLAPLEVAQAQNRERAVLLGAGVLLAGMLCPWPARRGAGPLVPARAAGGRSVG